MKQIDEVRNRVSGYFDIIGSDETPLSAKVLLIMAIVYFLSPIDLIPDFIPVIGYLDDLIIVPSLIWLAFRQIEAARLKKLELQKRDTVIGSADQRQCEVLR